MRLLKNPYLAMALVALVVQSVLLVFFYSLPDPLGLSMSEMFEGKTLWQIFMAFGAVLAMAGLFGFARAPRGLAIFYGLYFFAAVADYDVFRFSHQRLSYSFLRTYFHISNITDATTVSTLGGDLLGTVLWVTMVVLCLAGAIAFVTAYSLRLRKQRRSLVLSNQGGAWKPASRKIPGAMFAIGMALSLVPLVLFLTGTRGWIEIPVTHTKVDMRFTLGKHTLTAPILHIAAVETFEFIHDNAKITEELVGDLDAFLPKDFAAGRSDALELPMYRGAPTHEYKAKKPYNIVFIMGESFKGRSRAASLTRCLKAIRPWRRISGILLTLAVTGSRMPLAADIRRCVARWLLIWDSPRTRTATCQVSMPRISSRVGLNF